MPPRPRVALHTAGDTARQCPPHERAGHSSLLPVALLLLTVLGVYAYLCVEWLQMQNDSSSYPAQQLLNTSLHRAHTAVYDTLKYPVLTAQTISK